MEAHGRRVPVTLCRTVLKTSEIRALQKRVRTVPEIRGRTVRWSCHSGLANPVQILSTPPASSNGGPITILWASRPCGPAGWLAMILIKAGDVETNPGPTTTRKQVWICDICHRQIQVRKQISIRYNRNEHWVHPRCAGIRLAQYTDTWTCHQHR